MKKMNNYLDTKKLEIEYLAGLSDYPLVNLDNIVSFKNLFEIKEEIVKSIRKKSVEKYYHPLTNQNQLCFETNFFKYSYTYERFNGFIEIDNFAKDFYKINRNLVNHTYFSNCGMSSIVSLLTSIISANNIAVDLLYEETYFETIKYINMIADKSNIIKSLYIDSIASDFNFNKINIDDYTCVIIDTTCFFGSEFSDFIEYILDNNKYCILVRSHTKLDLLSTEYSHIGSVSFVYPNKISDEQINLYKKIESDCKHLIGVYGACLPPEKFPEFMFDEGLIKLNKRKINKVRENNKLLVEILLNNNIFVVLPSHKQFCLIYLKSNDYNLNDLKSEIIKFCNLNSDNYYLRHAVSFGFDYIAIDCYQNFIDNTFKIRVCMNDMTKDDVIIFSNILLEFLNRY